MEDGRMGPERDSRGKKRDRREKGERVVGGRRGRRGDKEAKDRSLVEREYLVAIKRISKGPREKKEASHRKIIRRAWQ